MQCSAAAVPATMLFAGDSSVEALYLSHRNLKIFGVANFSEPTRGNNFANESTEMYVNDRTVVFLKNPHLRGLASSPSGVHWASRHDAVLSGNVADVIGWPALSLPDGPKFCFRRRRPPTTAHLDNSRSYHICQHVWTSGECCRFVISGGRRGWNWHGRWAVGDGQLGRFGEGEGG